MDDGLKNIRESLGYEQSKQSLGFQGLGGGIPAVADKESLVEKSNRLEKEFYQYREMNEARAEQMQQIIARIVNFIGMR